MFKRLLIITIVLLGTQAWGKVTHVNYLATFGPFGKVGTITNTLTQTANSYKIETRVKLAGIANLLLNGQKEHYISKGHMENGHMVCDFYEMTTLKGSTKKVKTYHINHSKKYVSKQYRRWKNNKLIKDKKERLKFYAKDDLLTLYFNMNHALTEKGKTYHFNVVGLEKQKGKVSIQVPKSTQTKSYQRDLGSTADWYAKAGIVQENFKHNKGNILLSVSKDGFIKKAVIKNIMLYGNAELTRIK